MEFAVDYVGSYKPGKELGAIGSSTVNSTINNLLKKRAEPMYQQKTWTFRTVPAHLLPWHSSRWSSLTAISFGMHESEVQWTMNGHWHVIKVSVGSRNNLEHRNQVY